MSRLFAYTLAGLLGLAMLPNAASAQGYNNLLCNGFQGIPGYGVNLLPYSLGHVPVPPYFALHPPVYYSQPVPRTYGYSPYAYPGTVMTPEVTAPTAAMIENPYVEPAAEDRPVNHTAGGSEVILNPFATQRLAGK